MNDEAELTRRFADEGSQAAFAELVRRKIGLVHAAALRQVGGDAHLAQDVTQGVFLALACQAPRLKRHATLTGWLYTTTRFLATKAVRTQARWQRREREAGTMTAQPCETEPVWEQLRPTIDEAMCELAEKDRAALLLRFFEGRTLAEVGAAIGLAENAARMRVDRALEKLRERLARRGITSTAAAVGLLLAQQPAVAVPAGLAASVAAAAVAGSGALGAGVAGWAALGTGKALAAAAALLALGVAGGYLGAEYRIRDDAASVGPASGAARTPMAAGRASVAASPAAGAAPRTADASGDALTAALRAMIDLQRRDLVASTVTLVSAGARLTPQFAELFAVTPAEQGALQGSLDAARARMAELRRQNLSVVRSSSGDEVTIEAKPFPEAGGATYDAMMKSFAATLGAELYQAFLALGAEQAEKELGRFGTSHAVVTVSRETSDNGETRYRIRSRQHETPEDKATYVSDRLTPERFREEAQEFLELLPDDFLPRR